MSCPGSSVRTVHDRARCGDRRDTAEARSLRPLAVETAGEWPQTIFPFEVLRSAADGSEKSMDIATMKQVHRWLNPQTSPDGCRRPRCARRGVSRRCPVISASRSRSAGPSFCASAPARIWFGKPRLTPIWGAARGARLEAQIQRARLAVRKAELIARYYNSLFAGAATRGVGAPSPWRRGRGRCADQERVIGLAGTRLGTQQGLAQRTCVPGLPTIFWRSCWSRCSGVPSPPGDRTLPKSLERP